MAFPTPSPNSISEARVLFSEYSPPFSTVDGVAAKATLKHLLWSVSYSVNKLFPVQPSFDSYSSLIHSARRHFQSHCPPNAAVSDVEVLSILINNVTFLKWQVSYIAN